MLFRSGEGKHSFSWYGLDLRWSLRDPSEKVTPYLLTGLGVGRSHDPGLALSRKGAPTLGAGVIMKEGFSISGLTTAASIWAASAIGVLVGIGFYAAAILLALLSAASMLWISRLENWLPSRQAVAVIEQVREWTGHREHLFPCSTNPSKVMSENRGYRTFVLVRYPIGDANRLLKDKLQRERQDRNDADAAMEELEKEINSRKKAAPAPAQDKQSAAPVVDYSVATGPVNLEGKQVRLMDITDPKIRAIRDAAAAKPGAIVEHVTVQ